MAYSFMNILLRSLIFTCCCVLCDQIISMSRFCMIHGIEKFHPKESYFFNHDLALVLESFIRLFLEEFISSCILYSFIYSTIFLYICEVFGRSIAIYSTTILC
ncbi:hypothetical protein I3843_08G006800 [Carya illinoinensis]|nr:hypothetical protein I3843_08G006800 [Carya illinoinensis]